jgi:hypothetical protein
MFGSLSGFAAWIFIYPADLIKTKVQAASNNSRINTIIKNIYNNNNNKYKLLNFYNGFNLAILRAVPLHGGVFLGYEVSKKYLSENN